MLLGGTSAISSDIESELVGDGMAVERRAGTDRWGTATAIADFESTSSASTPPPTHIASGLSLPDALAGRPIASVRTSPIVLVSASSVPPPTSQWIQANAEDIDEVVARGGTAVISDSTLATAAELADEGDAAFAADESTGRVGTDETVTFPGIASETVNLALVDCDQVTVDEDGAVTFADSDGTVGVADLGAATAATITTITDVSSGYSIDEADVAVQDDGTAEAVVDTSDATCAVLVAFVDADDDSRLDLGEDDAATEPVAVSGQSLATNPTASRPRRRPTPTRSTAARTP